MWKLAGLLALAAGAIAVFSPRGATAAARQDQRPAAAESPRQSPQALADLIDRALLAAWKEQRIPVAEPADDAQWLRRLSIDLCGTIPEREEVAEFLADERPDKRARKIDEYLADPASAQNLSYLWNNSLLAGAQETRESRYLRPWLERQFAANVPFSEIARELIAGTGTTGENGATAFIAAYENQIEAVAAVTARTFLGVQIQCAQCHDHPDDRWKQADFNGFTGFFLGTRTQRALEADEYRLSDVPAEEIGEYQLRQLVTALKRARKTMNESDEPGEPDGGMDPRRRPMRGGLFPIDEATDEEVEEFLAALPATQRERIEKAREQREIFAEARYLDGGTHRDTSLLTRRQALAEWVIDPANPWFAAATVNRLWGHFFGAGLVDPVDDLTGSQDRVLPQLLDTVAAQFTQSGTDLHYLIRALARTRAYGLGSSLEEDSDSRAHQERWFAAHPLRPFTAEQVLHSLVRATATENERIARARDEEFEVIRRKILEKFRYVFSDDEGGDGDSFAASIPQALFLMNGFQTNDAITLRRSRMLDEILDETRSDRERLRQIFYATLSRPPTQREAEKLARLIRGAHGGGKRGIEDLYWALLNSTEFLTNH